MTWKDTMQAASFRGVPFFVETVDSEHGRKTVVHEYPYRDVPFIEDMGRKNRFFTVNAHVLGDNYDKLRDNLLNALEAKGPGVFVHPYRGSIRVVVERVTVRESVVGEAGIAYFTIEFSEYAPKSYPASSVSGLSTVERAVARYKLLAVLRFLNNIRLSGVSEFVRTALAASLGDFGAILVRLYDSGALNVRSPNDAQKIAAANFKTKASSLPGLVSDSTVLSNGIQAIMSDVALLSPTGEANVSSYTGISDAFIVTPRVSSFSGALVENSNKLELKRFVDGLAIASAAPAFAGLTFTSYDEAIQGRDGFVSRIASLLASSEGEEYDALYGIRKDIIAAVPGDQALPKLSLYRMPSPSPALVASYNIYGDASLDTDIIARNGVRNPLFIGPALKVLANA